MMKRTISFVIVFTFCFVDCIATASASTITPMDSPTISVQNASVSAGRNSGEIRIDFNISARGNASTLGASLIKVYNRNGSLVRTAIGTTSNGMLSSGSRYRGSYTYTGSSGTSYYAVVTFFAKVGTKTDSVNVTTTTITAP